jgi:hypothetical protein
MKNWFLVLAGVLLTTSLVSACQFKESTEGLVMVPETDFYFRLPKNYRVVYETDRMLQVQEEIVIEGTLYPFISPANFSIRIGTTIFEVSEFQRGPAEFDPKETFGHYYFEPEAMVSNQFEIYLAKAMKQDEREVQFLVSGIVAVGRTGVSVDAYGELSDLEQAYTAVKEILQSIRMIRE